MTAQQVLLRFGKEENKLKYVKKIIASLKPVVVKYISVGEQSYAGINYEEIVIDLFLKHQKRSISDFFSVYFHYKHPKLPFGFTKDFYTFCRTKLKGNQYKCLIPDEYHEIVRTHDYWGSYRERQGYHRLNYTFKDNSFN